VNVLKSLSNPVRVKLLYGLAQGSKVDEIGEEVGLSEAELAYHLRALYTYGLIAHTGSNGDTGDGWELTSRGTWLIEFLEEVSEKLTTGRDIETDLRCWRCGEELSVTVYPDHFKLWCPGCGGERGSRQILATGQNPIGVSWRDGSMRDTVLEGVQLEIDVLGAMLEREECRECGGSLSIVERDDRVEATCPSCGEQYQVGRNLDQFVSKLADAIDHDTSHETGYETSHGMDSGQ